MHWQMYYEAVHEMNDGKSYNQPAR